ncbi:MAG: hypothetical protein EHM20_04860 [Alphaproteobacteria bacterium]|nr:MAG: hypothetical protein EHM20_04860 [Alphaproteobacteria bacterium]
MYFEFFNGIIPYAPGGNDITIPLPPGAVNRLSHVLVTISEVRTSFGGADLYEPFIEGARMTVHIEDGDFAIV